MPKDLSCREFGDAPREENGSSGTGKKVLNCEQVGNTYCLELDDGTFIFMDFSCG